MNVQLRIDEIVRQTTVLIAQLSTSAGLRAPLSHVADQVFLELARELDAQGVRRKVVADMFGMALPTYQTKVRRLNENAEKTTGSLWQQLYADLCAVAPLARSWNAGTGLVRQTRSRRPCTTWCRAEWRTARVVAPRRSLA